MANARLLSKSLEATGWYTCVSDIHRPKGIHSLTQSSSSSKPIDAKDKENETSADYNAGLPVVAFRFSDAFRKEFPNIKQVDVSNLMRAKQYIIPNYPLPPNEEKVEILRVVVRESMSFDLLDRLITDLCVVTQAMIVSTLPPYGFHASDMRILWGSQESWSSIILAVHVIFLLCLQQRSC